MLSYSVLLLSNTLARWAAREYPRRFGISLPEWRVLSIVSARSPVAVGSIAEAISVDKAWVSRTLHRLKRDGWVRARQDRDDERRVYIEITVAGHRTAKRMLAASRDRQRRLVAGMGTVELNRFLAILVRLQARAESMLATDSPARPSMARKRR